MRLLASDTRGALRLVMLGLALQVLGQVWDLRWHAANPGVLETAGALLQAHSGIFLGVMVLLLGGLAAVAWSRREGADSRLRGWLLVVLVGALVQAAGVAWDSWRHVQSDESAVWASARVHRRAGRAGRHCGRRMAADQPPSHRRSFPVAGDEQGGVVLLVGPQGRHRGERERWQ
jgi:hypothetical protein